MIDGFKWLRVERKIMPMSRIMLPIISMASFCRVKVINSISDMQNSWHTDIRPITAFSKFMYLRRKANSKKVMKNKLILLEPV